MTTYKDLNKDYPYPEHSLSVLYKLPKEDGGVIINLLDAISMRDYNLGLYAQANIPFSSNLIAGINRKMPICPSGVL